MATVRRLAISTMAFLAILALAPGPSDEVSERWARLHALPIELRNHLADQLKAFDTLDRAEQEVVRTLDRKIQRRGRRESCELLCRHPPLQSLEFRACLRRSETSCWPRPPRSAWRWSQRFSRSGLHPTSWSHPSIISPNLGAFPHLTRPTRSRPGLRLTEGRKNGGREETRRNRSPATKRMAELAREKKIAPVPRPTAEELQAIHERVLKNEKFSFLKNIEKNEVLKKSEKLKQIRKKPAHQFLDNYYFVEKPPAKVSPDKLLQFERAVPSWIRGSYDTLPPEEARRRLTILYRLVFQTSEMPRGSPWARPAACLAASAQRRKPAAASKTTTPQKAATGASPF